MIAKWHDTCRTHIQLAFVCASPPKKVGDAMGLRGHLFVTLQLLLGLSNVSRSEFSNDELSILVFPNGADLTDIKKKENRGKMLSLSLRSFDENPLIYTDSVAFGTYLQQKTKVLRSAHSERTHGWRANDGCALFLPLRC